MSLQKILDIAIFKMRATYGALGRSRSFLAVYVFGLVILPLPGIYLGSHFLYESLIENVTTASGSFGLMSSTADLFLLIGAMIALMSPASVLYTFVDENCIAASPTSFRDFFFGACLATILNILTILGPISLGAAVSLSVVAGKSLVHILIIFLSTAVFLAFSTLFISCLAIMRHSEQHTRWILVVLFYATASLIPLLRIAGIEPLRHLELPLPGSIASAATFSILSGEEVVGLPGLSMLLGWLALILALCYVTSEKEAFHALTPVPLVAFGQTRMPRLFTRRFMRIFRFDPFRTGRMGALIQKGLIRIIRGGQLIALTLFLLSVNLSPFIVNGLLGSDLMGPMSKSSIILASTLILTSLLSTGWFLDVDEVIFVFSEAVDRREYARALFGTIVIASLMVAVVPTMVTMIVYGMLGVESLLASVGLASALAIASGASLLVTATLKPTATEIVFSPVEMTTVFASMIVATFLTSPVLVAYELPSSSLTANTIKLLLGPVYAAIISYGEYRLLARRLRKISF